MNGIMKMALTAFFLYTLFGCSRFPLFETQDVDSHSFTASHCRNQWSKTKSWIKPVEEGGEPAIGMAMDEYPTLQSCMQRYWPIDEVVWHDEADQ